MAKAPMASKRKGPKAPAQETDNFNWSELLVPDMTKAIRAALVFSISALMYVLFVNLMGISQQTVSLTLFDAKLLLLAVVSYVFASYSVMRKISILKTALIVLVPELLIVLYILNRFG